MGEWDNHILIPKWDDDDVSIPDCKVPCPWFVAFAEWIRGKYHCVVIVALVLFFTLKVSTFLHCHTFKLS